MRVDAGKRCYPIICYAICIISNLHQLILSLSLRMCACVYVCETESVRICVHAGKQCNPTICYATSLISKSFSLSLKVCVCVRVWLLVREVRMRVGVGWCVYCRYTNTIISKSLFLSPPLFLPPPLFCSLCLCVFVWLPV